MDKRFKPVLAAAVAAGLFPAISPFGPANVAFGASIASFTFDNLSTYTGPTGSNISYSFLAESGLATLTINRSASTNTNAPTSAAGNGSPFGLTSGNLIGANLTYKFSLDQLEDISISFDQSTSSTGPSQFIVQYSLDGTNFTGVSSYTAALNVTGSATTVTGAGSGNTTSSKTASQFAAGLSDNGFNYSFVLPAAFSDSVTGTPGQNGFIRILQSGSLAGNTASTLATTGTVRFDNVLISGDSVPEPTSAAVLTLAAAAMLRRPRKD